MIERPTSTAAGYLAEPERTPDVDRLYAEDVADSGYVMNLSRLWGHAPSAHDRLRDLLQDVAARAGLTLRQRAVLVVATASARRDAYCALGWGSRLAGEVGDEVAAALVAGDDERLAPEDRLLATWARRVATDPNGTGPEDVDALRAAGFDDGAIFAITAFVAFRMAFSSVNAALGGRPDAALAAAVPDAVREAVSFGRAPASSPSPGTAR